MLCVLYKRVFKGHFCAKERYLCFVFRHAEGVCGVRMASVEQSGVFRFALFVCGVISLEQKDLVGQIRRRISNYLKIQSFDNEPKVL